VDIARANSLLRRLDSLHADGGTDIAAGLEAAKELYEHVPGRAGIPERLLRSIVLTDGHGGEPLQVASELKQGLGVLLDVIAVGGDPSAVNENLLRQVATTDAQGFTHYWFIRDTESLVRQYEALATKIVWKGQ
jgi:hypothetical protein